MQTRIGVAEARVGTRRVRYTRSGVSLGFYDGCGVFPLQEDDDGGSEASLCLLAEMSYNCLFQPYKKKCDLRR